MQVIFFGAGGIRTLRNLFKKLDNGGYIIFENLFYESTKKLIRKFVAEFYYVISIIGVYGYDTQFVIQKRFLDKPASERAIATA